MENFDFIYDGMSKNYNDLEQIMSAVYQKTQFDSTDESSLELLKGLGEIAKNMIESQKEFTLAYCDPTIRETLVANLDGKQQTLMKALGETTNKTK